MPKAGYTSQGVRDLNSLGGKRVNGKKPPCKHYTDDIVVIGRAWFRDAEGDFCVPVLGCDRCGEKLGPETEFEERIK
jgi:hypothetical protein